jgi:hypothetical protein
MVASSMTLEFHDPLFPDPDRPALDHEWAALCAANGWIGLTKDKETNRSPLFLETVKATGAMVFVHIGAWTHEEIAQNVVNSRHKLAQFAHRHRRKAFIARLYMPSHHRFQRGGPGKITPIELW